MKGHIRIKVFAVLRLFDRLRAAPVREGQVWITTNPAMQIIQKENGCFVLLQQPGVKRTEVTVHAGIFQSAVFTVAESDTVKEHIVWLEPNETYDYSENTAFLTGVSKEELYLVLEEEPMLRLTADYKAGTEQIAVYGIQGEVRKTSYIFMQQQKLLSDIWEFQEKIQEGIFKLCMPFQRDYKRSETQIRRVYRIPRQEAGSFFMAFSAGKKGKVRGFWLQAGNAGQSFELEAGRTIQV